MNQAETKMSTDHNHPVPSPPSFKLDSSAKKLHTIFSLHFLSARTLVSSTHQPFPQPSWQVLRTWNMTLLARWSPETVDTKRSYLNTVMEHSSTEGPWKRRSTCIVFTATLSRSEAALPLGGARLQDFSPVRSM